ncbi:DUF2759 domain-containing protein [Sutcliffiella horikoshii]|uniref:DUF2759 domain-containing protein n=1 Tax=Sutcliffiella horikoshii TaxID=79883 RepID=A0A5D4SZQ9_9BACI|nr:DUF2759 domain-containing protein [Sutcliffiella horikoshii]TYS68715.1 DUF2759 domain-containing protein [Sutcliffiella horikoshii]
MPLVIIFGLVTLLCVFGLVRSLKEKNFLAVLFAFGTVAVFGWFTVMTVIEHGYPVAH